MPTRDNSLDLILSAFLQSWRKPVYNTLCVSCSVTIPGKNGAAGNSKIIELRFYAHLTCSEMFFLAKILTKY